MPVSTFRWASARTPTWRAAAWRASASGWLHTARVMRPSTAAGISSGKVGPSFRMGSPMPAARSSSPSGTVATPSQSAQPSASAMRLTSTAPWP